MTTTTPKIYAKAFTAKMVAAKMTKKAGIVFIFRATPEGYEVLSEAQAAAQAKSKLAQAFKDTAPVAASRKTNVVGRASSGAWLRQVTTFLLERDIDLNTVTTSVDAKRRIWVGDAKRPQLFWLRNPARAQAVVTSLTS